MKYYALQVFGSNNNQYQPKTFTPEITEIGDFDNLNQAAEQACKRLSCNHIARGVLSQSEGIGGYLIMDTNELIPE